MLSLSRNARAVVALALAVLHGAGRYAAAILRRRPRRRRAAPPRWRLAPLTVGVTADGHRPRQPRAPPLPA